MKKLTYIIAAAFILLLAGCDKEGDRTVDLDGGQKATLALFSTDVSVEIAEGNQSGTVVFKTRGGSARVDVKTNMRSWSVDNAGSQWLTVDQDQTGIALSAGAYEGKDTRSATVTITAGTGENAAKATLQVNQRGTGDPSIEPETDKVVFIPKDHKSIKTIKVTTNQDDWSFETETPSFWLRIEKGPDNTLVLQPDSNLLQKNDTLIVTLKAGVGANAATTKLMAVNEARAIIAFYPPKVIFMKAGSTEEVLVASTQPWQVGEYPEKWVTTEIRDGNLYVTAGENPDDGQRTCRLPLVCSGTGENSKTEYIDVLQWGKSEDQMVLEYKTTAANTSITLPLVGTVNCTINWGDGSPSEEVTKIKPTHKYAAAGTYQVKIQGTVTALSSQGLDASNKLVSRVLQWGKTGLTNMNNALAGCLNMTSIPGDVVHSFDEVTDFGSAFSACFGLTEIPADLLVNASKATNFNYIFSCSTKAAMDKITEIPAGLFDNCGNAESFSGIFWARRALKTIPDGLFDHISKAADMSYIFNEAGVTAVPAQLFAYCDGATNFSYMFAYSSLQTIPASLLLYNVNVTNISSMFANCKLLKEIPAGLLDELTEVTNIGSLFSNCELIKSIPAGLFNSMGKLTSAGTLFNGCKALEAIPAGLFDKMTGMTNFSGAFQNCVTLKAIPAGLFKNSPEVTNIGRVFNGCAALETVPADIFNCPNVTSANNSATLFMGCVNLKTIPKGLLDSFTGATGFKELFSGCTTLTTVPTSLFDNNKNVNSFANAFTGCAALTGESPYTEVDGVKVHLYERSEATGFKTPATKTKCFNGCTGLSDYESIPATWK